MLANPCRQEIGDLFAAAGLEVVLPGDELELLVLGGEGLVDGVGITGKDRSASDCTTSDGTVMRPRCGAPWHWDVSRLHIDRSGDRPTRDAG